MPTCTHRLPRSLNFRYSGLEEYHLRDQMSLEQARKKLKRFIKEDTILIGHGLNNDLHVLKVR